MGNHITDYHDFTTVDTPKKQRHEINVGDIWINAATCKGCGEYIRSRNRHDYVTCKCGNVSVDGGSWYARRSFKPEGPGFFNEIVSFADAEVS